MSTSTGRPPRSTLKVKVLEWMEGEGYPVEFQTAQVLRECGYGVTQGSHYQADSDEPREIDVIGELHAENNDLFVRVSNYVECKWSKDHPWVVFSSQHAAIAPSACISQSQGNDVGCAVLWALAGDPELHALGVFSAPRRVGFGGRQAFAKGKDQFYAAIQGAVGATQAALEERSDLGLDRAVRYAEIGFPVVAIEGELFEAFWDEARQGMRVERRDRLRLHWQGSSAWPMRASADVVTMKALPSFFRTRQEEIDRLLPKMLACVAEMRECIRTRSMKPLTVTKGARGYTGLPEFLRRVRQDIETPPSIAPSQPGENDA
jgi:hypothetical protein